MSATTAGATGGRAVWGRGLSTTQRHPGDHSKHNGEQLNEHHFGRTDQKAKQTVCLAAGRPD